MKKKKKPQTRQKAPLLCEYCSQRINMKIKPYHLENGCAQAKQCLFCKEVIVRSLDSIHIFQDYLVHFPFNCSWLKPRENRILILRKWNTCPACRRKVEGRIPNVNDSCDFCDPLLIEVAQVIDAQSKAKAAKWRHQQNYFTNGLEGVRQISSSETRGEGRHWATSKRKK
jgi:hypothetical protein